MDDIRVTHNEGAGRYELHVGDELASIAEYRRDDGRLVFNHTETNARFRGRGLGEKLVRGALDDVAASGKKIVPSCWFVAEFVESHPEYQRLVWQRAAS